MDVIANIVGNLLRSSLTVLVSRGIADGYGADLLRLRGKYWRTTVKSEGRTCTIEDGYQFLEGEIK